MTLIPLDHRNVMASRREPPDSLDFFPTPPWATRALIECVLRPRWAFWSDCAWDPACGEGHMSEVLREFFGRVEASDVFAYGAGEVHDFLSAEVLPAGAHWIITNPPFKTAEQFALRALGLAKVGVALLVRSAWLEGTGRYERLFRPRPPRVIAQFSERVPMTKGRWDPEASTATSYCWVVWLRDWSGPDTEFRWIPPGQRTKLTMADDAARFGVRVAAPLLEGAA